MKRYLPFIIVIVVALLAVGGGAMLYHAKRPGLTARGKNSGASAGKFDSDRMHIRGEHDAPVTIEEFGDFQCPPCGTLSPYLDEIERQYRPRVRLVFRNFPLPMHSHAAEAAYAAEAAGKQGRFWEMHDLLYREQDTWSKAANAKTLFTAYANMLGLNGDRFRADMQSAAIKEIVESDHRAGEERGVKSTPTVFVNNVIVPSSSLSKPGLSAAIDSALKEKETSAPKSK